MNLKILFNTVFISNHYVKQTNRNNHICFDSFALLKKLGHKTIKLPAMMHNYKPLHIY